MCKYFEIKGAERLLIERSALFMWLKIGVYLMLEAVAIDSVRRWDDVIGTVCATATIWIVDFLSKV